MNKILPFFLVVLLVNKSIFSITIETKSARLFENVTIQNETDNNIEFIDNDGLVNILRKDNIKNYYNDRKLDSNLKPNDLSLQTPVIFKEKSNPTILISQSIANDGAFQGSSLFGEKQSRRNNERYKSYNEAWNLNTGIEFVGLTKGLQMGITFLNPLIDRTNTDSDLNYQSTSGGVSKNSTVIDSINSGTLQFDPNEIKKRKEKNGLNDYFFSRINYEHNTAFGTFGIGFLFININTPAYLMRSLYIITWKPAFFTYLNPVFTINNRMLSELGGIYQGNHNYRLTISHEYNLSERFRITPSLVIGYQDVNNNLDMKKGVSDISPRLQLNYLNYFLALNYMFRASPFLSDNKNYYPDIGRYPDRDQNDERTIDPSKVNGLTNNFIIDSINANAPSDIVKNYLINKYQQQKIISGIFFFNIGYTLRF